MAHSKTKVLECLSCDQRLTLYDAPEGYTMQLVHDVTKRHRLLFEVAHEIHPGDQA